MNMKYFVLSALLFSFIYLAKAGPLRLQKRAAFYIANETACVVDNTVYNSGDPIPTDDPCEACRCRPPGFACVLKECVSKPGCRAVRRTGQCCPEYVCGCEHNGRMYRDGDEIRDSQNPCYTCHCQGSSIACAFVDCFFRVDCAPEYVPGECCPNYNHCASLDSDNSTNVDTAFSTEKAHVYEETTASAKTSESPLYSEIPENIADVQATSINGKESSESLPPESLDSSILFSVNEDSNFGIQTTKKDIFTEAVAEESELASDETSPAAESSEENSSEKQIENVTELLKNDFEIINDEEEHKTPESSPNYVSSEATVGTSIFETTDKNVEIFPVEESTTVDENIKTASPTEVSAQTTVSSSTEFADSLEDTTDDEANELSKRLRSLKNLTSDDVTESPNESLDVKGDESKDIISTDESEKVVTLVSTEKSTTVRLEKDIVPEDKKEEVKYSDTTTETVSKSENLYYNSDVETASETVETVTTVVEVKEPSSSDKIDGETSSPVVEPQQVLFKALSDVAKADDQEKTTVKPNEAIATRTPTEILDSETSKIVDVPSSGLPSGTDNSEKNERPYADESEIVPSTEAAKVIEVESSSKAIPESSSEKVEASKD